MVRWPDSVGNKAHGVCACPAEGCPGFDTVLCPTETKGRRDGHAAARSPSGDHPWRTSRAQRCYSAGELCSPPDEEPQVIREEPQGPLLRGNPMRHLVFNTHTSCTPFWGRKPRAQARRLTSQQLRRATSLLQKQKSAESLT